MKNFTLLVLLSSSFTLTSAAHAFGFSDIQVWAGSGSNEAGLVVDWQDGSTHPELVFGYRWDGTASGEDMIKAIASADPELSLGITTYSFGDAVTSIGYDGSAYGASGPGSHYASGFDPGTPGFWDYYTGSGSTIPAWTESGVGAGDRVLANNSWDGWSWAANFNSIAPSNTPLAAPVPEPASVFGVVGGLILLRRRRRTSSGR